MEFWTHDGESPAGAGTSSESPSGSYLSIGGDGRTMNYLVVVAHPDDEVLGAGGVMHRLTTEGHTVDVCVMSAEAHARDRRPSTEDLYSDTEAACALLGVGRLIPGPFPNIEFNTVPHLHLVKFIEDAIVETEAQVVITHHPADLNNDHLHTSLACQAATKLCQRRAGLAPIVDVLLMEVVSATDWSLHSGMRPFEPNTFVELSDVDISKKLEALASYRGVMREHPHPRSVESITGLARFRGSQAGISYAEAFQSVFRRGMLGESVTH